MTNHLIRADELIELAPDGQLLNGPAAAEMLMQEYGLTPYRAKSAVARAARQRRYNSQPDHIRRLTPSTAVSEFGGSASNIRRACTLGYIQAEQDDTGRWSFTVQDFKAWLDRGKHTTGKDGRYSEIIRLAGPDPQAIHNLAAAHHDLDQAMAQGDDQAIQESATRCAICAIQAMASGLRSQRETDGAITRLAQLTNQPDDTLLDAALARLQ